MPSPATWCLWLKGIGCSRGTPTSVRYGERWSEPPTSAKAVRASTAAAIDTREMVFVLGWKICGIGPAVPAAAPV